jgi:hemerythrin superfamily protein
LPSDRSQLVFKLHSYWYRACLNTEKQTQKGDYMSKKIENDIIDLILEDHRPLQQLIKTLKSDAEFENKFMAFQEFAPLLVMHAKPEEQTVYVKMKKNEETREDGFEGDVEHALADQLVEEIKRTTDEDVFMARVKVLAELVEHHIEEEEEELLPEFRKTTSAEERATLAKSFMKLKNELGEMEGDDAPPEAMLAKFQKNKGMDSSHSTKH